jgi:hypothetical protein
VRRKKAEFTSRGKRREGKRSLHQGKRKQRKRGPQKWPALGVLAAQAGEKEAKAIHGKDARGTSKAEDLASARIYVLQGTTCCRRRKGGKSEGEEQGKGRDMSQPQPALDIFAAK